MDREIKFRAWDEKMKRYEYGTFNEIRLHMVAAFHTYGINVFEQYTGQKDKNGAEIYKGSDVLVTWDDGETEQYKVDWSDELWGFCLDTETRLPCSSQIEVIHDKEQQ